MAMIDQYKLAIYFMQLLNNTFTGNWYCENVNEDPESWVFTDGDRRQKPVPRDPFQPLTQQNLMFKEQRTWTTIMNERVQRQTPPALDFTEDSLLALEPDDLRRKP